MLTSMSGKAILTKIKAMYGSRITPQNYAELLHKRTVSEVAGFLKNETHYNAVLASIQESTIHRGQLEHLIRMESYMQYLRILHYDKNPNCFYDYFIYSLENTEILTCLRQVASGRSVAYISSLPLYLERLMEFSLIDLAKANTYPEMLKVLEKTPYKRLMEPYLPPKSPIPDITTCEQVMRKAYYQRIEALITANYTGSTAIELRSIYQTRAELNNVAAIYRLKKYFNAPPQEIFHAMLPVKGRIPPHMWRLLIETPSGEEFLKQLVHSPYGKYMDSNSNFDYIEYTTHSIRYNLSRHHLNYSTEAPVVFAAYMILMEIERENLVNIIEGIRYDLQPEEIETLLIH